MCATCGCDSNGNVSIREVNDHSHAHTHDHEHHHHDHDHSHSHHKTVVEVEKDVLHENNLLAERNRGYFDAKNILAMNLVSSPGSGKTSLLEKTLTDLKGQFDFYVIEGDQQTTNDADRIHATGTKVVQINTGKGCHLDAHMVLHALQGMKPKENAIMFIENVGNLVCPAMFDLGEKERVVIMSVTEGDDKPLKYPDMFHSSTLCIINKIDLLSYVPFDIEKAKANALKVNHHLEIIELSCTSGEGMQQWYNWLKKRVTVPEIA
ncbi:MAG: hydrogenase nickel incorporation protein HypB [Bacteroidetes bacterium]|nr:hydrogenase nickel incorporation protein HypB [Bacteroidota bacterium]